VKVPILHYKEVVKALQKAGFKIVGGEGGSHLRLKKERNSPNEPPRIVIVPRHTEIARGTLHNILTRAGLSLEEFLKLL
jgi:predicted RNA binding protein YcfA (HicA-like mRNA interferase family)